MKLEYKRELDHNYLVLEEEQGEQREGYEIYMLEENQIPGLLSCTLQRINQRQRFFYEVTSRQSLDLLLERKRLDYTDLIHILEGIRRALSGAREYLLDVNHLLLRSEYIYVNLDLDLPEFCYFPYYERAVREQFFELAEYLLGKLDRQDRLGVELGYEIYKMASEENCSIEEILKLREKYSGDKEKAAKQIRLTWEEPERAARYRVAEPVNVYGEAVEQGAQEPRGKLMEERRKPFEKRRKPFEIRKNSMATPHDSEEMRKKSTGTQKRSSEMPKRKLWEKKKVQQTEEEQLYLEERPILSGQTTVQSWEMPRGETCLLSEGKRQGLVLYSLDPSLESLPVSGDYFLVGKKQDAVDGFIDHPGVSRIHARIEKREQSYYVTDLNSTNGTYLNRKLLGVNETVLLHVGDVLRFADVEYTVGTAMGTV